ncbi:hypothetical protein [Massilia sp.]|uniref:hypothetical protein n=1 Tax=Massilia sp. TaxID=1882437 RepID=UPI0028B173FC|nr:hypothetical protein [Massilia sp.]
MRMLATAMLLLNLACAAPALAGIFTKREPGGVTVYSNIPSGPRVDQPAARPSRAAAAGTAAAGFPRISRAEQRKRDLGREAILNEELDNEQQLLARARARQAAADVQRRHLGNIAAIKRELAGLR